MNIGAMTVVLFGLMLVGLALGLPLAFVLGGIGAIATFFFWGHKPFLPLSPAPLARCSPSCW